jgi:hypothetical protein
MDFEHRAGEYRRDVAMGLGTDGITTLCRRNAGVLAGWLGGVSPPFIEALR